MDNGILLLGIVIAATLILFISNRVRLDLVAIMACLALAWLGLISPSEAISGFASNAVVAMASVMILGYGIERTGVTSRLANTIIRYGSIQIPWHDLRTRHKELSRDKKYILMCKGGLRASIAASILKMNGINNVFNMAGGFTAYQKLGICTLAE